MLYKKLFIMLIFFTLAYSNIAASTTRADIYKLPTTPVTKRIHYGNNNLQFADLRIPNGPGPYPVVIVVHGGCWLAKFANLEITAPLASALTEAGLATWNIEYRRVDNPGGGWPGTFLDIGKAIDYLPTIAEQYKLDLKHVIVIGHSAGGQLALWAAARSKLSKTSPLYTAKPLPLQGAINLAGPGNLISFLPMQGCVCDEKIVTRMLGGTPEEKPERYHDASPSELLPLGVKQVLITGSDDFSISPILGRQYQHAALKVNDEVEFTIVQGVNHIELLSPQSKAWPVIKQSALNLVK